MRFDRTATCSECGVGELDLDEGLCSGCFKELYDECPECGDFYDKNELTDDCCTQCQINNDTAQSS